MTKKTKKKKISLSVLFPTSPSSPEKTITFFFIYTPSSSSSPSFIIMDDDDFLDAEEEHESITTIAARRTASTTPLSAIAESFEEISRSIKSKTFQDLRLSTFSDACALVSVLFGCLGIAFKFAELEYVAKVRDLLEASKHYETLNNILDHDVENDTVRKPGSLSRNLRRVRQGLDLIRALFQQFLSSDDCSLREAASTAYAQVCAPFHTWAIRTAVFAGMYALPSKQQLILKLNETDQTVEKEMRRYIDASLPVIEYIDKLFISKNITLDW